MKRHKQTIGGIAFAFMMSLMLFAFQPSTSNSSRISNKMEKTIQQGYEIYIGGLINNLSLKIKPVSINDFAGIDEDIYGLPIMVFPIK